jgi:hypothetical protein
MVYTNKTSINSHIKKSHLIDDYGDIKIYQDESGYRWRYTILWSDMLEKDIELLETYPVTPVSDLIKLIPTISDLETIAAISMSIAQRNFDNDINNRELLIRVLEEELAPNSEKLDKVKLCIYESELFDATNRTEIIGKFTADIEKYAAVYQSIAKRAKAILDYKLN